MVVVRRRQATELIEKQVDWRLLLYLIALYVNIAGVNQTPIPGTFWKLLQPLTGHQQPPVFVFGFCLLVLVLSLVFTSIPAVLLIRYLRCLHEHARTLSSPWVSLSVCTSLSSRPSRLSHGYMRLDAHTPQFHTDPAVTNTFL